MILAALVAAWMVTWASGKLARAAGQPAVLGELVAGILLGSSALGILDPSNAVVHAVSNAGVMLLLFTIGLETDIRSLLRVGSSALQVAVIGVVVPMMLGYFAAIALGVNPTAALVCGAALCATSVGITARVLSDLGKLASVEGRVILGAAVVDDVIGLGILAAVASLASKGTASAGGLGSFAIVGAFGLGLALHQTSRRHVIEQNVKLVNRFVVPLFFASVGAALNTNTLGAESVALGSALIGCGVAGKLLAGAGAWRERADKLFIGIGMIPRGEVGLIFAQMGMATGALTSNHYGALMMMVLVTTFVTPPLLAWRAARLPKYV